MIALQSLAAELAITVSNGEVWLAVGEGLMFGAAAFLVGAQVARRVGLLAPDAPAGEALAVGLACGLMVLAAWWATLWSGGRSSFTPVAIGFAVAVGLALLGPTRPRPEAVDPGRGAEAGLHVIKSRRTGARAMGLTLLAGAAFIVAVALLYGATVAPSPRDGVQPVEFMDEAFYSVLGRDLAATGTETNIPPSGFAEIDGVPTQAWYHWGELWLAAALITVVGMEPLAARHFVVLPLVLLAAAALTGTVVRLLGRTSSRRAYVFGFAACLFLAPVPYVWGPVFGWWAVGLIFGVTLYGLAAVAMLLALYSVAVVGRRAPTWSVAVFVGSAVAFILPAHIVVALLGLMGLLTMWVARFIRLLRRTGRLPTMSAAWRRVLVATVPVLLATVAWGVFTDHGVSSSVGAPPSVSPFNPTWVVSVAAIYLGAGVMLAIPFAWVVARTSSSTRADLYLGTMVLLFVGAIVWGARIGDFNMFHVFFAGIAVIATPVAVVATLDLWRHLRETEQLRLAGAVVALCVIQLDIGAAYSIIRLQMFGPGEYQPIPIGLLSAISRLPQDAKLAYACQPLEEVAFTDPRLISIDAHTGRRVVPMCFQADFFSTLVGGPKPTTVASPSFAWAPQRALYPDATANPSSAAVTAFMKEHGIDYIYADAGHPNSLVDDAVPIAQVGDAAVLRLP